MKEIDFKNGRLSFCNEKYEMLPSLPDSLEPRIQLFCIDENGLLESGFSDFDQLKELKVEKKLLWIHIQGLPNEQFWKELTKFLDVSDEQTKYVRSPHRRSFFEDFDNGIFWSLQKPFNTDNVDALETVNFIIVDKTIVTRQFSNDSAFSLVTHKIMSKGSQSSEWGCDSLAGELIEDILHSYLDFLKLGATRLEVIQNKIIRRPGKAELNLINRSQQLIWIYLNAVWPVETILQAIVHSRNPVISAAGRRDFEARLSEANSVLRLFETYRSMSYNLMDVYVSGLGLRTNETTMVLTIIATLFLPPTLIAGIYGMNFQIPEVHVAGGYYLCLAGMFAVSGGLLVWLKKRGYIQF